MEGNMTERFKLKQGWMVVYLIIGIISLVVAVGCMYAYFFEDDAAVFLFVALLGGIGSFGMCFAVMDMRNHYIEVSEEGFTTYKKRVDFSWDQVQRIVDLDGNTAIHYKNQDGQSKTVTIGPIIDGYEYLAVLVKKHTAGSKGENG
jgi:hypothetical protein